MKDLYIQQLALQRQGLSAKQKAKKIKVRGKWLYPAGVERDYYFFIRAAMKSFVEIAMESISGKIGDWVDEWNRSDNAIEDWESTTALLLQKQKKLFEEGAESRAFYANILSFGQATDEFNKAQFEKFIEQLIKQPVFPYEPWVDTVVKAWGNTNQELIKGLSEDYIKSINTTVFEAVRNGESVKSVTATLQKLNKDITGYRAKLIARDQVSKLTGQFTKARNQDAGLNLYIWSTSGDNRVRPDHKIMDGRLCRWDNPNVYSEDGGKTWIDRGSGVKKHPGMDIQCRCGSLPVFDELLDAADDLIKE